MDGGCEGEELLLLLLLLFVVDGARESGRSRQHTQTPTKQRRQEGTRRKPSSLCGARKVNENLCENRPTPPTGGSAMYIAHSKNNKDDDESQRQRQVSHRNV